MDTAGTGEDDRRLDHPHPGVWDWAGRTGTPGAAPEPWLRRRARVGVTTWRAGRGPGADWGGRYATCDDGNGTKHGDMTGHEWCATGCVVEYGGGKPVHPLLEAAQESAE